MTILLDHYTLPERGLVKLTINQDFEINVTAEEARRQVDRWLFDEVSYMMTAETPVLVLGEGVVWRVPAILTASQVGRVGSVGTVDVDVQTGQMDDKPENIAALQQAGIDLGNRLPPYQPREALPDGYWANDLQPTRPRPQRQTNLSLVLAITP